MAGVHHTLPAELLPRPLDRAPRSRQLPPILVRSGWDTRACCPLPCTRRAQDGEELGPSPGTGFPGPRVTLEAGDRGAAHGPHPSPACCMRAARLRSWCPCARCQHAGKELTRAGQAGWQHPQFLCWSLCETRGAGAGREGRIEALCASLLWEQATGCLPGPATLPAHWDCCVIPAAPAPSCAVLGQAARATPGLAIGPWSVGSCPGCGKWGVILGLRRLLSRGPGAMHALALDRGASPTPCQAWLGGCPLPGGSQALGRWSRLGETRGSGWVRGPILPAAGSLLRGASSSACSLCSHRACTWAWVPAHLCTRA